MSAGRIIDSKMFRAVLDSDGSYLQRKDGTGAKIPLVRCRRSFYLRARVAAVRADLDGKVRYQVAPTMEEIYENPEMQDDNDEVRQLHRLFLLMQDAWHGLLA